MENNKIAEEEYGKNTVLEIARRVNFLDYMTVKHPSMIAFDKRTCSYIHPDFDSLKYYEHGYYRFSTGTGGDGIGFLKEWLDMSFEKAVIDLYEFGTKNPSSIMFLDTYGDIKIYKPPKEGKDYRYAYEYLTRDRGIACSLVGALMDSGAIYEDIRHNVVFINNASDNKMAIARATPHSPNPSYKRMYLEHSNNYWAFACTSEVKRIYICESPIDAMSLYRIVKDDSGLYAAMGGLKPNTFSKIVHDFEGCEVVIAVDWDEPGSKFALSQKRRFKNIPHILAPSEEKRGNTKDWNQYLTKKRDRELLS